MKKTLTIILSLFFTLIIYAQRNYQEGYILTSQNDTLRGWIDFRSDKLNATVCTFKSDLKNEEKEYYPKEIYGYRYLNDGKFYVSREIEINGTKKTVFLEFLLEGIENLYYYKEGEVKYYILENMKGELLYTSQEPEKLTYIGENQNYVTDYKYIGILKLYFKNQPEILKKVDKTTYDHQSMIKLVKEYHDLVCTPDQACIIFESKNIKDALIIKYSIYAGYNYLSGYKILTRYNIDFDGLMDKNYPVIGGQVSLNVPRLSKSINFDLGISLSSLKGEKKYYNNNNELARTFKINSLVGFLKLGPSYTYHKGIIRPTVGAGIALVKIFDPNVILNVYKSDEEKKDYNISSTALGLYLSAGIDVKIANKGFVFIKATYDKYITSIKNLDQTYVGARIGYTF